YDRLGELDEPEFCSYYAEEFYEIRLVLPNDHNGVNITKAITEQFLHSLSFASYPISFEVIGNSERIVVQFAATYDDLPQLEQQLAVHFPGISFVKSECNDYLINNWINSDECGVIVDFGLSE